MRMGALLDGFYVRADAGKPASAAEGAPDLRRRLLVAQILICLRTAVHNLSAGVIAVMLIVIGTGYSRRTGEMTILPVSLLWGGAVIATMFSGIWIAMRFSKPDQTEEDTLKGGAFYLVNALVAAVAWGSSSWLLLPASIEQEAFLLAVMAMVVAAGGGAQAMFRPLIRVFTITLTVVFTLGLLRLGEFYYVIITTAYVIYNLAIVLYANDQEDAVAKNIRLSAVNENLLAKTVLEREVALLAHAEAERARAEAEQANRAKTTFIAAASHDLRQPLHALVQYVAHLKRESRDDRIVPTVEKIEESVAAMEGLLNAVLDLSKISMGAVKPAFQSMDLAGVLQRLDNQIRPLAAARNLVLDLKWTSAAVESDERLLLRVLSNVAHNAIRYTQEGRVVIRTRAWPGRVRILIADSGIGIAAQNKDAIFEEFYQVGNTARDRRKGLGLGLAIVRNLAAMLKLRIRVKSRIGVGSVFVIDVPPASAVVVSAVEPSSSPEFDHVRGAFVVLIDDDRLARDAAELTLRGFGCRVLAASSAQEAINLLTQAEFAPQMVVSDYRLENGITGLEAIAMLKENQANLFGDDFDVKAILISGDTSPLELQRVATAGYRMLHKPVAAGALYSTLNDELGRLAKGGIRAEP